VENLASHLERSTNCVHMDGWSEKTRTWTQKNHGKMIVDFHQHCAFGFITSSRFRRVTRPSTSVERIKEHAGRWPDNCEKSSIQNRPIPEPDGGGALKCDTSALIPERPDGKPDFIFWIKTKYIRPCPRSNYRI